jgi:hypothetical protein
MPRQMLQTPSTRRLTTSAAPSPLCRAKPPAFTRESHGPGRGQRLSSQLAVPQNLLAPGPSLPPSLPPTHTTAARRADVHVDVRPSAPRRTLTARKSRSKRPRKARSCTAWPCSRGRSPLHPAQASQSSMHTRGRRVRRVHGCVRGPSPSCVQMVCNAWNEDR